MFKHMMLFLRVGLGEVRDRMMFEVMEISMSFLTADLRAGYFFQGGSEDWGHRQLNENFWNFWKFTENFIK